MHSDDVRVFFRTSRGCSTPPKWTAPRSSKNTVRHHERTYDISSPNNTFEHDADSLACAVRSLRLNLSETIGEGVLLLPSPAPKK